MSTSVGGGIFPCFQITYLSMHPRTESTCAVLCCHECQQHSGRGMNVLSLIIVVQSSNYLLVLWADILISNFNTAKTELFFQQEALLGESVHLYNHAHILLQCSTQSQHFSAIWPRAQPKTTVMMWFRVQFAWLCNLHCAWQSLSMLYSTYSKQGVVTQRISRCLKHGIW